MTYKKEFKTKQLRDGEYISRTQKPISKVATAALKVRSKGISAVRGELALISASYANCVGESFEYLRAQAGELIASLNFSCRDAEKELQRRK